MAEDLADVAARGDHLETLKALRDYLARALDETQSARDQASLSARLMECVARIDELTPDAGEEKDDLADLIALPGATG